MTSTRSSESKRSRNVSSTGTATLYGRLATSAVGASPGSVVTSKRVRAHDLEPLADVGHVRRDRVGELAREDGVDLDRDDARARLEQPEGQRAEPGPDLDDALARADVRRTHDLADGAAVVHEVLAEGLRGADAETPRQVTDLGRTQQGASGIAHGTQAYRPDADRPSPGTTKGGAPCAPPSAVFVGPPSGGRVRAVRAQRSPSLRAHAGHWPQPERAWSAWARCVCSAAEASEGRPEPPIARHVDSENWYRP